MTNHSGKTLEDVLYDLNKKLSGLGQKKSGSGGSNGPGEFTPQGGWQGPLTIVIVLLIIVGAYSSYYTIDVSEEGVITRFQAYHKTTQPGLHFKLPFGIDKVYKIPSRRILTEEFGFRTADTRGLRTQYSKGGAASESLMLTGDLNVADVEWVVQYRISDPWKFMFHARDVRKNIRDVSMSIMRRVVGDKLVSDVLTTGRVTIAKEATELTQTVIDRYDMGIKIKRIILQDVNPPKEVKNAFNEVNEAKQEQEETINVAEREYNKTIPKARGAAEKKISEAKAYATALINHAQGNANKFTEVLKAYQKSPAITRKRMYYETIQKVFTNVKDFTIVDTKVKGLLPVFDSSNKVPVTK